MQYGQRYRVQRTNREIVEGEYIQTRGNDEAFPTFILGDGTRIGASRDDVLGGVCDDAQPGGIERPAIEIFEFVNPPSDTLLRKIIYLNGDD